MQWGQGRDGGRHAVIKFKRAVIVNEQQKESIRYNIAVECRRLKAIQQRRRTDETNSL